MRIVRADDAPPLLDREALDAALDTAVADSGGDDARLRPVRIRILKEAVSTALRRAEEFLLIDGGGLACAERLSSAQDALIAAINAHAQRHVYPLANPSDAERIAICAVGGYGRGTLAPGSDIDLLFLRPSKQTAWGEQVVEFILYTLWDLGFKVGHATRTASECVKLARGDLTIRTALLEKRLIDGDAALFEELQARYRSEVMKGTGPEFIAAKLAERDERHKKQGTSRYVVEPNIKEGKGGLRDLNTLVWIGRYFYMTDSAAELVKAGVYTRAEYQRLRKCEDFLWATRCHLHFANRRADERLSFDLQPEIARRLGYTEHPGLKDVERFMKHYFLVAKDVGDLTRILCAELEENHAKARPMLDRVLGPLSRRSPKKIPGSTDFLVDNGRINIADEEVFQRDPANLLRLFQLADRHGLALHPDGTRLVTKSLKLVTPALRDSEVANQLFLDILTSTNRPEATLRRMNETGLLGRFVPDFGKVVAMMQFNMYHHYTVDEHLLRTLGILCEIEGGHLTEDHPLASTLIPTIQNRTALYVTLFLHDIAKGRPEDHSVAGARIARRICPRFGLSASETELVAWLIEEHLTMSMIAQSRDLSDRKTIADFAARVQTLERLKLLLILTVCDIRAVGPGVWNGWKGQLLRTLYYETEVLITGGHSQAAREMRVAAAREALSHAIADWPDAERASYLDLHYPAYWLRVELERQVGHAHMVRAAQKAGSRLSTAIAMHAFEGVTEVTVYAPDHPRLLSVLAGACVVAGADIVDAQIHTTTDGHALDTIFVRREFSDDADERRRADRIAATVEQALEGRVELSRVIAERGGPRERTKPFRVPPEVTIDNRSSDRFTVIEASALDRPGLLFDLTRTLADLSLDIGSAHIATFGERAVDVFYVTDLTGAKVTNAQRIGRIRRQLEQSLVVSEENRSKPAARPRQRRKATGTA